LSDAAGVVMREVPAYGHRGAALDGGVSPQGGELVLRRDRVGHFKHVSAFSFIPELGIWTIYDVGFRRTRLVHLADTDHAKTILANIVKGNCTVTVEARRTICR
jgi:hypothetical protein